MKHVIAGITAALMLAACGKPATFQPPNLPAKEYPTYGFFNEDTSKSEHICYKVSVGNVVWSVLLVETVIAPVYFVGWSIFNPVAVRGADGKCPASPTIDD